MNNKKERTRSEIRNELSNLINEHGYLEYKIPFLVKELKSKAKKLTEEERELFEDAEYIGF